MKAATDVAGRPQRDRRTDEQRRTDELTFQAAIDAGMRTIARQRDAFAAVIMLSAEYTDDIARRSDNSDVLLNCLTGTYIALHHGRDTAVQLTWSDPRRGGMSKTVHIPTRAQLATLVDHPDRDGIIDTYTQLREDNVDHDAAWVLANAL